MKVKQYQQPACTTFKRHDQSPNNKQHVSWNGYHVRTYVTEEEAKANKAPPGPLIREITDIHMTFEQHRRQNPGFLVRAIRDKIFDIKNACCCLLDCIIQAT